MIQYYLNGKITIHSELEIKLSQKDYFSVILDVIFGSAHLNSNTGCVKSYSWKRPVGPPGVVGSGAV
jgi:hypothetical protein